ncbi:MAG TPA: hypothetical protein VG713_16885, partial [Pirellulales bacterium]|nr:hypothetical protein [Pirellulales bacterium]
MSRPSIERELRQVATRLRWRTLLRDLTLVWLSGLGLAWLTVWLAEATGGPWPGVALGTTITAASIVILVRGAKRRLDLRSVAQQVERRYPDLDTRLLAAYDEERRAAAADCGYLARAIIDQAQLHARWNRCWRDTVPTSQLVAWSGGHVIALALLLATFVLVPLHWPAPPQA